MHPSNSIRSDMRKSVGLEVPDATTACPSRTSNTQMTGDQQSRHLQKAGGGGKGRSGFLSAQWRWPNEHSTCQLCSTGFLASRQLYSFLGPQRRRATPINSSLNGGLSALASSTSCFCFSEEFAQAIIEVIVASRQRKNLFNGETFRQSRTRMFHYLRGLVVQWFAAK